MKKDVIYIDIEDDITSIIEKVKAAEAKIVALVPPKRTGVLQSVVNLKLLQKAAGSSDHRVVLITSDQQLTALASGVQMPVAKNLQSKPEVAPIDALEIDDEDVINGEELPVGDLAKTADVQGASTVPGKSGGAKTDDASLTAAAAASAASLGPKSPGPRTGTGEKGKSRIPDFESFRKKIFIFGGLAVLLVGFLVWAIVYAPRATVTIKAKTSAVNIDEVVALDPDQAQSDVPAGIFKPVVKQVKKSAAAEFDATGKKDIGNKATGTLTLSNDDGQEVTVPAGTTFIAQDLQFMSTQSVTVPAASICARSTICPGTEEVGIAAADIGPEYNVGPQGYTTNAPVSARSDDATSGGSKETVSVVSQADVDKAKGQLAQNDAEAVKKELAGQFGGDVIVIAESFQTGQGEPKVSPAVGERATRGTLSAETTYTLLGISRSDAKKYLDEQLNQQLEGREDQQIYASGDQNLRFSQFQAAENGSYSVRLSAVANIGPRIDTGTLTADIRGKQFGDIEQRVMSIDGVEDVGVDFSPFWVTAAPGATDKIDIKFQITNEE